MEWLYISNETYTRLLIVLVGVIAGTALAITDWKSKFTIGGLVALAGSAIASFTIEKIEAAKRFLESSALLRPILITVDIALGTFVLVLLGSAVFIFFSNLRAYKRKSDPEAFYKSVRKSFYIFSAGLYRYNVYDPELERENKISELASYIKVQISLLKTVTHEMTEPHASEQHFKDIFRAEAKYMLMTCFNETADLQMYRLALFIKKDKRLMNYSSVNNRDWTSHSGKDFPIDGSFMGEAINRDRPLVYPKDKKIKMRFEKRKGARYKSFVAIPVPCGLGESHSVGAITVDYVGKHEAFTPMKVEVLYFFAQCVYLLYIKMLLSAMPLETKSHD